MALCSIFKNLNKPIDQQALLDIAKEISSDKYKTNIEKIRSLLSAGKTEEAQELKKQLQSFTPSGVFKSRRVKEEIEKYNGIIHLDFDKLTDEQISNAQSVICSNPLTHLCFISPSGNGLKVFVEVTSGIEDHLKAYKQVQAYYEKLTGLKADPSCKDITRLCFVSYDPKLYRNINNELFCVNAMKGLGDLEASTETPLNEESIFNQQIQFTNRIKTYEPGSRNAYVYQLANNCKHAGLSEQITIELISKNFDLSYKEIEQTVKSAFKRSLIGSERFKVLETASQPSEDVAEDDSSSLTMPTLPDEIYSTLPDFLKRVISVAKTYEQRDILLLGSLTTLSVALHQVAGKYDDTIVNPNLYLFISAAPSAGKGVLNHCRKLVLPIHKRLREKSKLLHEIYHAEIQEYRMNKNKDASLEPPQKPPKIMLFIPANNSATGFLRTLFDSNQRGIIFETEGDTLSKAFKTDYGDFSDSFRNAFHHEPISYYRRTDEEYVEIDRPCLSVLLSGTPKQIQVLIPNAENGLFSRFMFYVMNMNYDWKNVFYSLTDAGLELYFEQLGDEFFTFYKEMELLPEMTFTLTKDQQEKFNTFFDGIQKLYMALQEEDIISSVRRLGVTAYRIMMILSTLRLMESKKRLRTLVCEDIDFDNTLKMISVLIQHSSHILNQIAQEPKEVKAKNRREMFLDQLPAEFNRRGYLEVCRKLNIADRTARRYIHKFEQAGLLAKPYHDNYIKVQKELNQNTAK